VGNDYAYQLLEKIHTPDVKALWQYCFDDAPSFVDWYFENYYVPSNTLGAFERSDLVAALQMIPYTVFIRNTPLPVSYIVGISTAAHARGGGIGKELLRSSLVEMKNKGHFLSLLMPFEGSFYFPYDWNFCYFHHRYTLDLEELRLLRTNFGNFEKVEPKNHIPLLNELYTQFVSSTHGYVIRTPQNWIHLIEDLAFEEGHCYVLKDKEVPIGYVLYYFDKEKIVIREMAYTTPLAKRAFFDFFYKHRSHKKSLTWSSPVNDLTYSQIGTSKISTHLYPFLTARIVDVVGLLSALHYTEDMPRVRLKITDTLAPWNDGIFIFEVKNKKGIIQTCVQSPSHEASYDVSISIGGLSQLIMGFVDVDTLISEGILDILGKNEDFSSFLAKTFPKMTNYINEYY
jgi:predicted acetyltransferase